MASVGCALSPNLSVLLFFRVLQGLSAGGSTIIGRTIIRDLFDGPEAQRMMSRVMMIFGLAPAVAPIIGGLLLRVGPWPAIFWFIGGVGGLGGGARGGGVPGGEPRGGRRPPRPRPPPPGPVGGGAGPAAFHHSRRRRGGRGVCMGGRRHCQ